MSFKERIRPFAELNDDDLEGVSGGNMGPVQPMPSRPSIPPDPGLPQATPTPTPTPQPTPTPVPTPTPAPTSRGTSGMR